MRTVTIKKFKEAALQSMQQIYRRTFIEITFLHKHLRRADFEFTVNLIWKSCILSRMNDLVDTINM